MLDKFEKVTIYYNETSKIFEFKTIELKHMLTERHNHGITYVSINNK